MTFKHTVDEEHTVINRSDRYSAEILGYDVFITETDSVFSLSVAPTYWQDGCRLPALSCHPKSVAEIEKLGEVAPELFKAIAGELRRMGKEDLRSKWDKMRDNMEDKFK